MAIRVIKMGGSLLDLPQLGGKLTNWLDKQPPASNLLVVGGGELVEAVRRYDQVHLSPDQGASIHWLCVDLLNKTARLVLWLLPNGEWIDSRDALSAWLGSHEAPRRPAIVAPSAYYARDAIDESSTLRLPEDWSTTSDALAAALAIGIAADELVLLKSRLPVSGQSPHEWSQDGLVDPVFPELADKISKVSIATLRSQR